MEVLLARGQSTYTFPAGLGSHLDDLVDTASIDVCGAHLDLEFGRRQAVAHYLLGRARDESQLL